MKWKTTKYGQMNRLKIKYADHSDYVELINMLINEICQVRLWSKKYFFSKLWNEWNKKILQIPTILVAITKLGWLTIEWWTP